MFVSIFKQSADPQKIKIPKCQKTTFLEIQKIKNRGKGVSTNGPFTTARGSGGGSPWENALRADCRVKNSTLGMYEPRYTSTHARHGATVSALKQFTISPPVRMGGVPPINQVLVDHGTLIFLYKSPTIWIENLNSAWSNYPEKNQKTSAAQFRVRFIMFYDCS